MSESTITIAPITRALKIASTGRISPRAPPRMRWPSDAGSPGDADAGAAGAGAGCAGAGGGGGVAGVGWGGVGSDIRGHHVGQLPCRLELGDAHRSGAAHE